MVTSARAFLRFCLFFCREYQTKVHFCWLHYRNVPLGNVAQSRKLGSAENAWKSKNRKICSIQIFQPKKKMLLAGLRSSYLLDKGRCQELDTAALRMIRELLLHSRGTHFIPDLEASLMAQAKRNQSNTVESP